MNAITNCVLQFMITLPLSQWYFERQLFLHASLYEINLSLGPRFKRS